jgi:hypothetical protein
LEGQARILGTQINFCDGNDVEDGLEISVNNMGEVKRSELKAPYYLIETDRSMGSFQKVVRRKCGIIRTTLTPTKAKMMKSKDRHLEMCIRKIIQSSGFKRVSEIRRFRKNLKLARKFMVPMIVTTGSKSIYELRSPNQVYELLRILGFDDWEATKSMYTNPVELMNYGKEIMAGKIISKALRVI